MPDFATLRSGAARVTAFTLIGLALVVSPLAGLVTPYLIGLISLLLLLFYVTTGRARRVFSGFAERAYLAAFIVIAATFALSAKVPADIAYVANFSMLLLFAPMLHLFGDATRRGNEWLLSGLAVAGLVLALAMLVVQVKLVGARPGGFNIGSIVLANAAIALAVVATLPLMRSRDWRSTLLVGAPLLALAIVWMTSSRGPLLALTPLFLVLAFFVWRVRLRGAVWFPLLVVPTIVVLGLGAAALMTRGGRSVVELVSELLSGTDITNTAARARLVFHEAGWRAFLDSPWIGHGWAHLMDAVVPYLSAEDMEFARLSQLHNDVLNFAVSGGVVGIACYFVILTAPTIAAWRSVRDGFYATRLYGTSALMGVYAGAGLTDLMFGHEFHTAFYITLNAIILGMCRDPAPPRPQTT